MYNFSDIENYIFQNRPEGLIVDTNVLILLLIGSYNSDYIKECSRLNDYSEKEFKLLKKIIQYFNGRKLIITPYIIAELSNLTITQGFKGKKLNDYVKIVINHLREFGEKHLRLSSLIEININLISRFGFTDMAILEIAKQNRMPILTDEMDLTAYAESLGIGIPVIKFSRIIADDKLNQNK